MKLPVTSAVYRGCCMDRHISTKDRKLSDFAWYVWGSVCSVLCKQLNQVVQNICSRWSQHYPPICVCVIHIQSTHTHAHADWSPSTHMKRNMFLDDSLQCWGLSFLPLASGHLGDLKQTPAGVRSCFCNHIYFLWSPRTVCVCVCVCVRV